MMDLSAIGSSLGAVGAKGVRFWHRSRQRVMTGVLLSTMSLAAVAGGASFTGSAMAATTGIIFTTTANLVTARSHAVTMVLANGDVLVAGGFGATGAPLSSAEL